jgi:hypothetical protein
VFSIFTHSEIQINLSGFFPNRNENYRRKVLKLIVSDLSVDTVTQIMEEAKSQVVGPHTSHMMDSSAQILRYVLLAVLMMSLRLFFQVKNIIFIKRKNGYIRKIS